MSNYRNRANFSDRAHEVAVRTCYSYLLNLPLAHMHIQKASHHDDSKRGIDYTAHVLTKNGSIPLTIQERWRHISKVKYQELTIRVTGKTGANSELNFLEADYMIYGVFDDKRDSIAKALLVNLPALKMYMALNWQGLPLFTAPSGETFVRLTYEQLRLAHAFVRYYAGYN